MNALVLFERLGLRPDASERDVRRAYARELKTIDQEAQPELFQQLRESYEQLTMWLKHQQISQVAAVENQGRDPEEVPDAAAQEVGKNVAAVNQLNEQPGVKIAGVDQADEVCNGAMPNARASRESLESHAREMLGLVEQRLVHAPFFNREEAEAFLNECLADERLQNVDSRHYFEWGIASILASGWRPGHELLFSPALNCFGWVHDRSRLMWFGRPGHIVDAAIAEVAVYDSQSPADRELQRDVIRALRFEHKPTKSELIRQLPVAEFLLRIFPNWLHVISKPETIGAWRTWRDTIPRWHLRLFDRKRAYDANGREQSKSASRGNLAPKLLLILLVAGVLSQMSFVSPTGTTINNTELVAAPSKLSPLSASYVAQIRTRIKSNIIYSGPLLGNPTAEIAVSLSSDGRIIDRTLIKSSGVRLWDEAAIRAIDKTGALPRDVNGLVPPSLILVLSPME